MSTISERNTHLEKTSLDPMQILGMSGINLETLVQIMLESRGISLSHPASKEPSDDEIEEMWALANGEENV